MVKNTEKIEGVTHDYKLDQKISIRRKSLFVQAFKKRQFKEESLNSKIMVKLAHYMQQKKWEKSTVFSFFAWYLKMGRRHYAGSTHFVEKEWRFWCFFGPFAFADNSKRSTRADFVALFSFTSSQFFFLTQRRFFSAVFKKSKSWRKGFFSEILQIYEIFFCTH